MLKKVVLLASALITALSLSLVSFYVGPNTGVSAVDAVSVGVYWDYDCTCLVESINWGSLSPGSSTMVSLFFRNEVDADVRLSLNTTGWKPTHASEDLALDWNYTRGLLRPGELVHTTLSLSVSPRITNVTDFSFDIVISATEDEGCTIDMFAVLFADNPDVRVIYPSDNIVKPLDCSAATISDWLASAFIYVELANAVEGLDTDDAFLDPATGKAQGEKGVGVVSFGGPMVNPLVKHVESDQTPPTDRAPIRYRGEGGMCIFQRWDGQYIPGASLPASVINEDQDMFVIETYEDGHGRYFLLCYGFGWKGTYAAGKYFHTEVFPNLASYHYPWVIVKWQDRNGDGFVNTGADGDVYTLVATGP